MWFDSARTTAELKFKSHSSSEHKKKKKKKIIIRAHIGNNVLFWVLPRAGRGESRLFVPGAGSGRLRGRAGAEPADPGLPGPLRCAGHQVGWAGPGRARPPRIGAAEGAAERRAGKAEGSLARR